MTRTVKAWAIVKEGKLAVNALTLEGQFMPAIYWTRKAARYFRCLNNGERVRRVHVTVMPRDS